MKKTKILCLVIFFVFIQGINAAATEVEMSVTTDEGMNATIIQVANTSINTSIYCYAGSCEYNLNNGNVMIGNNTNNITFAQYDTYITEYNDGGGSGGGLSLNGLVHKLMSAVYKYLNGIDDTTTSGMLLKVLDDVFVSHAEHQVTLGNIEYIAGEVDRLNAEVYIMKEYLGNFTPNALYLEAITGAERSRRLGQQVTTENGFVCDFTVFGHDCFRLVQLE